MLSNCMAALLEWDFDLLTFGNNIKLNSVLTIKSTFFHASSANFDLLVF